MPPDAALLDALGRAHAHKARVVHLLVGVPGSGKSTLAQKLQTYFEHAPHDAQAHRDYAAHLIARSRKPGDKAILGEVPFAAHALQDALQAAGVPCRTYYLDVPLETAQARYEARRGQPYPQQHMSNHERYSLRGDWDYRGSPEALEQTLQEAADAP